MSVRRLILCFGLVNACLYAALLPLWEGSDEAFHYGYVETLWQTGRLPVLGHTLLPDDVFRSFYFAPVSHVIRREILCATTFDVWSELPAARKEERRQNLNRLRPTQATTSRPNYEAHHPPLAYLFFSIIDRAALTASLPVRALLLRLFAAAAGVLLLYVGATQLSRTLELPPAFTNAFLLTMFCSQMLYATIAHIANDWLAVGLSALFLAALARFALRPDARSALTSAAWLTLGLLTKAYFLVFALLALGTAGMLLWRRRLSIGPVLPALFLVLVLAGPWYWRNVHLYGNMSGTQEQFDGIGITQALAAAPRMNWISTAGFLARSSLWTGNNSFTTFSRGTLTVMLALLLLAMAAWILQGKKATPAEWVLIAAIVLFSLAVGYASCVTFVATKGEAPGASPWYAQVLLAPVLSLAFLGMSRSAALGVLLARCTVVLWTWVIIASWVVKLFPMYSGAGDAPMHLNALWNWYRHGAFDHARDLSLLALLPAPWLYTGLLFSLTLSVLLSATIVANFRPRHHATDLVR